MYLTSQRGGRNLLAYWSPVVAPLALAALQPDRGQVMRGLKGSMEYTERERVLFESRVNGRLRVWAGMIEELKVKVSRAAGENQSNEYDFIQGLVLIQGLLEKIAVLQKEFHSLEQEQDGGWQGQKARVEAALADLERDSERVGSQFS